MSARILRNINTEKRKVMKKYLLRGGLALLLVVSAFLLQNSICRVIPFFKVAPNILLIVTFSIGFLRGKVAGMMTGLLCGLLLDAFSGGVLGYYTLIFIYIGYFNGLLSRILVNDMILLPLGLCLINEVCYSAYIYIFSILLMGKSNLMDYIRTIALPELVMTFFCTIILYGVIMAGNRRLTASEKN